MSNIQLIILLLLSQVSFACAAVGSASSTEKHSARAMTPVDILELSKISDGQLSSDGKVILYLKNELNWQRNRWLQQLWRYQIDTANSRQLTFGYNSVRSPVIAPNSQQVAFLTARNKDKVPHIYLMHLDGGEAFKLTDLKQKPSNLSWSHDSKYLYFTAQAKPTKINSKTAQIKPFEDPNNTKALWRVEISSAKVEQLTDGKESIVYYQLASDNNLILLSKAPGRLLDQRHQAELWLMNLATQKQQRLTNNDHYERNARLSANGKALVYAATVNSNNEQYHNNNLFVFDMSSQKSQILTQNFSGEVESFEWASANNKIYFTANIGVSTHLHQVDIINGHIQQLTFGDWTTNEWHYQPAQNQHVIEKRSATEPGDLWLGTGSEQDLTRLTKHYQDIQQRFLLPQQEKLSWPSHDGVTIEGLLTYPLNYQAGTPFPLVVQTHGGPRSSDQFGLWSTTDHLPVLAAKGYGILMVNHRGGTGYGDEFLRDMVGQYFRNAHLDVLSGIDHLVAKGFADPDKLVKMGWSAGGHMTNKLITMTDRFKAASSGAGVVDWVSMYGETDASYMRTWWFGGKPWQKNAPIENYNEDSVVSQLWKVKTPTLIFVGEEDVRVPATQSKILFRALRDLGVETELYIAPDEPHGYRKPKHRLFKINKELEWFERHVQQKEYQHQEIPE